jgi:hypothetical protein
VYSIDRLLMRGVNLRSAGVDGFFDPPPEAYASPGFWVAQAARARSRGLHFADLPIRADMRDYAMAMELEAALGDPDTYPLERRNEGANYSPLVVLDRPERVDPSSEVIGRCVETQFAELGLPGFVDQLVSVIGDMHDNVWSHGKSTGISMAQAWSKPNTGRAERFFEFALADCGYGFLGELRRARLTRKLGVNSDKDAIAWCIVKGHSSKAIEQGDEFAQRLPEDALHNPIGRDAVVLDEGTHHLGMGLPKLVDLVLQYGGLLSLATGRFMYLVLPNGKHRYTQVACPWQGVTMACRFATDEVRRRLRRPTGDGVDRALRAIIGGRK